MPSEKQKAAWALAGARLKELGKPFRFKKRKRSLEERLADVEKCLMGLVIMMSLLAGISVYLVIIK